MEEAEAFAKELDALRNHKPQFITDEFEKLFEECEDLLPEWDEYPGESSQDYDSYLKWVNNNNTKDIQLMCDLMYKRGQFMTPEMYAQYCEWKDNSCEEWHKCTVEELELV